MFHNITPKPWRNTDIIYSHAHVMVLQVDRLGHIVWSASISFLSLNGVVSVFQFSSVF